MNLFLKLVELGYQSLDLPVVESLLLSQFGQRSPERLAADNTGQPLFNQEAYRLWILPDQIINFDIGLNRITK